MLIENQHPDNKSIMVSVLGAPNVGKSSLINYLLGMDLSIVSSRPQTTRNRFNCVFTVDRVEIILVDTPGLHRSSLELNRRINEQAKEGADGTDLNLLLIDLTKDVLAQIVEFQSLVDKELGPTWLIFTKSDRISDLDKLPLDDVLEKAKDVIPSIERYFAISVKNGDNIHELTGALCDHAEPGPHLYPGGEVSNRNQRFFVTEYIREQAFELLQDELPYELAVVIEEYRDIRPKTAEDKPMAHISATILVNRPSQRAIVVGSKGSMIKQIGTNARKKIEKMAGHPVHLNLHVKVSPKWFKNNYVLEEIGLPRAKDSTRVWRKS